MRHFATLHITAHPAYPIEFVALVITYPGDTIGGELTYYHFGLLQIIFQHVGNTPQWDFAVNVRVSSCSIL